MRKRYRLRGSMIVVATAAVIAVLGLESNGYILASVHRPLNTDIDEWPLSIMGAFLEIEEPVMLPLHPCAVKSLERVGWYERLKSAPHITVLPPQGYLEFLELLTNARLVITDSGGVQREAYFGKTPCVTLFPNTAWPETVEDGWNVCIDAVKGELLEAAKSFSPSKEQREIFGDGKAGKKIVDEILKFLDDPRPIYS